MRCFRIVTKIRTDFVLVFGNVVLLWRLTMGILEACLLVFCLEFNFNVFERTAEWATGWDIGKTGNAAERGPWWVNPAGTFGPPPGDVKPPTVE